ncbi:hypothetical protein TNIN_240451, partial [Trichonephila inaurata madagascariensis]
GNRGRFLLHTHSPPSTAVIPQMAIGQCFQNMIKVIRQKMRGGGIDPHGHRPSPKDWVIYLAEEPSKCNLMKTHRVLEGSY